MTNKRGSTRGWLCVLLTSGRMRRLTRWWPLPRVTRRGWHSTAHDLLTDGQQSLLSLVVIFFGGDAACGRRQQIIGVRTESFESCWQKKQSSRCVDRWYSLSFHVYYPVFISYTLPRHWRLCQAWRLPSSRGWTLNSDFPDAMLLSTRSIVTVKVVIPVTILTTTSTTVTASIPTKAMYSNDCDKHWPASKNPIGNFHQLTSPVTLGYPLRMERTERDLQPAKATLSFLLQCLPICRMRLETTNAWTKEISSEVHHGRQRFSSISCAGFGKANSDDSESFRNRNKVLSLRDFLSFFLLPSSLLRHYQQMVPGRECRPPKVIGLGENRHSPRKSLVFCRL